MGRLDRRVAIVTGAGRGIGRALAIRLAREGACVIVNDLDGGPTEDVVGEIRSSGGQAVACAGSITDPEMPERLVGLATEAFGDLHIIVNNAGYTWDSVIQKMSEDQFDAMIDVHLKAPWRLLKAASEIIRIKTKEEANRGEEIIRKVVNISSIAGTRGNAGQSNYASAKAGIVGLSRTMAKEWGRYKVAVNSVAFGLIETRLTEATDEKKLINVTGNTIPVGVPVQNIEAMKQAIPLGRGGTPDEAAGAVLLFCLPESDYISGQLIEVTGGF